MRQKRVLVIFLAVLLVMPFSLAGIGNGVWAAGKNNRYYYNQLSTEAKGIYDAMYNMYDQGIFQTGTQEYDLVGNGHITSEQLAAYDGNMEGIQSLLGVARDAFYADYPDIFYVDFSSLSITVSGSGDSGYKASLGIGRRDNYYVEGFTGIQQVQSAVGEYNRKVSQIAQSAKNSSQSVREQVIYVNQAIIDNTEYKLESSCSPGNSGHVRTAYGALIKHESLCEGYARAVKAVLDSMGIPCVLVQGYYRAPDGSDNLHMWNYVQIDGMWYGLDATANDGMKGGTDSGMYLLADSTVMGKSHRPDGVMSGAGFRFQYPTLAGGSGDGGNEPEEDGADSPDNIDSEGYKTIFNQKDLVVKYKEGVNEDGEVGIFLVSYKGMGYQEAVDKEKVYLLVRFYQYMPGLDDYKVGNWGYADPKPFVVTQPEHGLLIPNSNSRYIEFAVTKYPPAGPLYGDNLTAAELEENWNFQGTEADFIVSTGQLDNPKGVFVPSPYAKTLTPSATGFITAGQKYTVTAVFTETLEEYNGQKAGYKLEVTDGWSAVKYSKIENFQWDGDKTVTFQFTPSDMLADNYAVYTVTVTGLRGVESHKEPDGFSYKAKKKIAICAYRPQGIYLNLGAKPQLVEPGDLSYNGWMTSDGKPLTSVVGKLALVASKPELVVKDPTADESKTMVDMIEKDLGDTVVKSATYKLNLMTCNQNIISTGDSVRLQIGFPEYFGPDEEGVTYKAYHFITDKSGNITGVEELDCIVMEKGLVITCNSFSPFAIARVKMDEAEEEERVKTKKVLVLNSEGGEVRVTGNGTGENKIWKLSKEKAAGAGSEITVKITAKEGYAVDKICLSKQAGTVARPVTNAKSMELKVRYDDLSDYDNILEVDFAPDAPKNDVAANAGTDTTPAKQSDTSKKSDKDKKKSDKDEKKSEESKLSGQGETDNQNQGGTSGQTSGAGNGQVSGSKTDSNTGKAPAASQEQAQAPETTSQAKASSSSLGSKTSGQQLAEEGADRETPVEQGADSEEIASDSLEEYAQLASPPVGANGMQEITDADIVGKKTGIGEILWTIGISVAGAGAVVAGLGAYVKIKRRLTK